MTTPPCLEALALLLGHHCTTALAEYDVSCGSQVLTVVDATSRPCPYPILQAARHAKNLPAGSPFFLLASDPASLSDVPAWCRMAGHSLIASAQVSDELLEASVKAPASADGVDAAPAVPQNLVDCYWFCILTAAAN